MKHKLIKNTKTINHNNKTQKHILIIINKTQKTISYNNKTQKHILIIINKNAKKQLIIIIKTQ